MKKKLLLLGIGLTLTLCCGLIIRCFNSPNTINVSNTTNSNYVLSKADLEAQNYVLKHLYDEEKHYDLMVNPEYIKLLSNVVYGEAGALSKLEKSAVVWCILNRVDKGYGNGDIFAVVTAENQFTGYKPNRAYKTEAEKKLLKECEEIAFDVLVRWYKEKDGIEDIGRTLPRDYYWFLGWDHHNHFMNKWKDKSTEWDWSLTNPYEG